MSLLCANGVLEFCLLCLWVVCPISRSPWYGAGFVGDVLPVLDISSLIHSFHFKPVYCNSTTATSVYSVHLLHVCLPWKRDSPSVALSEVFFLFNNLCKGGKYSWVDYSYTYRRKSLLPDLASCFVPCNTNNLHYININKYSIFSNYYIVIPQSIYL